MGEYRVTSILCPICNSSLTIEDYNSVYVVWARCNRCDKLFDMNYLYGYYDGYNKGHKEGMI